ncbi:MAG: dTDP-4-dehydrorhamnose 3,5-epimerase [Proteobacteria bacterium]|nr:dTDP-4-dehydrorhamnose 3,5-epimerase [Desulfobacula sp.]MBU3951929.1 dTDP-4-dehydrorhamnose 3,5-epimerase [Pseudomonadota bacterium]MBU4132613.1 dTDP-4-dehydrorhamnose 3,5-epimerase [Pseudomonadota bacterium]
MEIIETNLRDVKILRPQVFGDDRGFFMETFREKFFKTQVADFDFVQDNHSSSGQGILRGLHYQIRQTQGKLVRVISGQVFDVAVDIRKNSPDFGKWTGVVLSAENKDMFWVPPGFAHGFYVMSGQAEFVYKCTDYYAPEFERSIFWNDPAIGIDWPLVNGQPPKLSPKDAAGLLLETAEVF